MRLVYKYVVPKRIDVIENGRIRFTQAAALNDPFETYPCLSLFNESLKERSRAVLKSVEKQFYDRSLVLGKFMIPKMVRDKTIQLQRDLSNDYPMLSLTTKRNNLLMWSHYAMAHRGFVIGLDSDHLFFHREKPRRMTPLSRVKYLKTRPVLPALEECEPEKVHEIVFLTKGEHWAYEEELRMFAQPEAADLVLKGDDGFDIYLFKFPQECLKEIIFGHQMQPVLKQKVSDIVERQYSHVELFETRLNDNDFDLDITPYGKLALRNEGAA